MPIAVAMASTHYLKVVKLGCEENAVQSMLIMCVYLLDPLLSQNQTCTRERNRPKTIYDK